MCRSLSDGGRRCPNSHSGRHASNETAECLAAAALVSLVSAEEVTEQRLYGGQTAETVLVTDPDGHRAVRKRGRPGDHPSDVRHWVDAEYLSYRLGEAVGAPVARVHRASDDEVWVEHIEGEATPLTDDLASSADGIRLGLVDALSGNSDRAENLILRDGRLIGYDHGGGWVPYTLGDRGPYLREKAAPMRHFINGDTYADDPPMPAAELSRIRRRMETLRPEFDRLNRTAWLDHSLHVLSEIKRRSADIG